jgi:hypothetical protein
MNVCPSEPATVTAGLCAFSSIHTLLIRESKKKNDHLVILYDTTMKPLGNLSTIPIALFSSSRYLANQWTPCSTSIYEAPLQHALELCMPSPSTFLVQVTTFLLHPGPALFSYSLSSSLLAKAIMRELAVNRSCHIKYTTNLSDYVSTFMWLGIGLSIL